MTLSIKWLFLFRIVYSEQKENLKVIDGKFSAVVWFTFLPVTLFEMQNSIFLLFIIYIVIVSSAGAQ